MSFIVPSITTIKGRTTGVFFTFIILIKMQPYDDIDSLKNYLIHKKNIGKLIEILILE